MRLRRRTLYSHAVKESLCHDQLSDRQLLLFVGAVGLVAHYFFFRQCSEHFLYDSPEYLAGMRNLVTRHEFLDSMGRVDVRRTPGYPLFLVPFALVNATVAGTVAVQHLLAVVLAVAVQVAAWRVSGSRAIGLFSGLIVALDPGLIFIANYIMTETLASLMLFALMLSLGVRKGDRWLARAGVSGLLVGATCLVRPIVAFLWIPLAIWLLLFDRQPDGNRWRTVRTVAVFVLAALLLPAAWSYRNRIRTGVASFSSIELEDLYAWRAAGVEATAETGFVYAPLPTSTAEDGFRALFMRKVQKDFTQRLAAALEAAVHERGRPLSVRERDDLERSMSWKIILQHPWSTFLMTLNGALHFVFDSAWPFAYQAVDSLSRTPLIYLQALLSLLEFPLAVIGWLFLRRSAPRTAAVIGIILLYFIAVGSGPEQEQWRYRIPVIPLYAIFVAAGLEALRRRWSGGHRGIAGSLTPASNR
jgi:hypothetical protein